MIDINLIAYMREELSHTSTLFRRYMYDRILWDDRMIGIVGPRGVGKAEKIFIDNPNLMYALQGQKTNIGSVRETFFYNQLRVNNEVTSTKNTDFRIGDYIFEVGGAGKGQKQLQGNPNGAIVKDDIEYGHANIVPLWQFGLNY